MCVCVCVCMCVCARARAPHVYLSDCLSVCARARRTSVCLTVCQCARAHIIHMRMFSNEQLHNTILASVYATFIVHKMRTTPITPHNTRETTSLYKRHQLTVHTQYPCIHPGTKQVYEVTKGKILSKNMFSTTRLILIVNPTEICFN